MVFKNCLARSSLPVSAYFLHLQALTGQHRNLRRTQNTAAPVSIDEYNGCPAPLLVGEGRAKSRKHNVKTADEINKGAADEIMYYSHCPVRDSPVSFPCVFFDSSVILPSWSIGRKLLKSGRISVLLIPPSYQPHSCSIAERLEISSDLFIVQKAFHSCSPD